MRGITLTPRTTDRLVDTTSISLHQSREGVGSSVWPNGNDAFATMVLKKLRGVHSFWPDAIRPFVRPSTPFFQVMEESCITHI